MLLPLSQVTSYLDLHPFHCGFLYHEHPLEDFDEEVKGKPANPGDVYVEAVLSKEVIIQIAKFQTGSRIAPSFSHKPAHADTSRQRVLAHT